VSPGLAAHPAYARSLDVLRDCGVRLVPADGLQPAEPGGPYRWPAIAAALTQ
jgi:hypothetical protein